MSITSMEIKFSNIGINTANQPQKNILHSRNSSGF